MGVLAAALVLSTAVAQAGGSTVIIVNADPPDAGFNDPTPATPVGGNPGTTLGAQRLAVFKEAARIWGLALDSTVPITVLSRFVPLACDSNGATLGSAGPTNIFASDDPTLDAGRPPTFFPKERTWYVSAETAALAGTQLLPGTGTDPNDYDIVARFNSTFDDPNATNCHGFVWYYGLDNQHGTKLDLLTVVLHELGHGLGFISLTDPATGEFPLGEQDAWSWLLYDGTTGKHWNELDAAGRQASAVSATLAWDGPTVKAAVPTTLAVAPLVRVTSAPATPAAVRDYFPVAPAQFGAAITAGAGVSGPLGVGSNGFGCAGQDKLAPLDGKIAIVDRGGPTLPDGGGCAFVDKARNVQDAGAIGLLVANNRVGLTGPGGTAPDVVIPVLMVTQADGTTLKAAVDAGAVIAAMLLDPSANSFQGADTGRRPLMYAPPVLSSGSSVSHWDITAFPNLLMEPNISQDLTHSLDLTVPLLHDIGWSTDGGTPPDAGTPADAGTGGGGGGSKSGCSVSSGPASAWLGLLGLLLFVRRKRTA